MERVISRNRLERVAAAEPTNDPVEGTEEQNPRDGTDGGCQAEAPEAAPSFGVGGKERAEPCGSESKDEAGDGGAVVGGLRDLGDSQFDEALGREAVEGLFACAVERSEAVGVDEGGGALEEENGELLVVEVEELGAGERDIER